MSEHRELPLVQAFVPCREIYEDARSNEYILIGPFASIALDNIPGKFRFSLYLRMVEGRGEYRFGFELRDAQDELVWDWHVPPPLIFDDPLESHQIALYDIAIPVKRPGRYQLSLIIEDQPASHVTLTFSERGKP